MNPVQRTPLDRLLLATDGLDPHVVEAILLIWNEEQMRMLTIYEAQQALIEALQTELGEYRRREAEWEIARASMNRSLDTLNCITHSVAVRQLEHHGYTLVWTRALPEGGLG